ncbi:uncharacterized protein LOC8031041 isoform X2 [Ixodes scapularis]|uniref:uncharacterized protein LOC8031041 isoform X2 n=1 Tax=Ixodes scapularis TaxID=6945 RepID=UPI001C3861BB|nr:uncharacterized protein LOC8031041 isoform X2 [Ixodes scapularis]
MSEAELPPVQRRRCTAERREWKKLVEIQQQLLLTSSRSSKRGSSSSPSSVEKDVLQRSEPLKAPGPKQKATSSSSHELAVQACSSAPALLGEQRILLHTAEVMETLSILLQSDSSASSTCSGAEMRHESRRERLKALHTQIKSLMKQRCLLLLKKECNRQLGLVRLLRDRTRDLALAEDTLVNQLLSSGHPILPGDVLQLSFLRKAGFLDSLEAATRAWPRLLQFLGHTLNSLDAEWHGCLDVVLRWAHGRLDSLARQLIRWAWLSLRNDVWLLCHMDAADLHADWIAALYASCQRFQLASHWPRVDPVSAVLRTLATRQAHLAANRLSTFLCAEARKAPQMCALSETLWERTPDDWTACREAPFLAALLQSGQSLLFKYLLAATCLNHLIPSHEAKQSQGRPLWQKQIQQGTRPSCFQLEKLYWNQYWQCFVSQMLRRLTLVHQGSQLTTEAMALCPLGMNLVLLQSLACQEHGNSFLAQPHSIELPPAAVSSMMHVCQILFAHLVLSCWRHAMSAALAQQGNAQGTTPGSQLLRALQPLTAYLSTAPRIVCKDSSLVKHHLALTLGHILQWSEARLRHWLHSWEPEQLVLMASSLLQTIASVKCTKKSWEEHPSTGSPYADCTSALEALEALQAAVPSEYKKGCYQVCLRKWSSSMPAAKDFRKRGAGEASVFVEPVVKDVLDPAISGVQGCPAAVQAVYTRLTVEAVLEAWKTTVQTKGLKFSPQVHLEKEIVAAHVEGSNLDPDAKHAVRSHLPAEQNNGPARRALLPSNRVAPGGPSMEDSAPLEQQQGRLRFKLCCNF